MSFITSPVIFGTTGIINGVLFFGIVYYIVDSIEHGFRLAPWYFYTSLLALYALGRSLESIKHIRIVLKHNPSAFQKYKDELNFAVAFFALVVAIIGLIYMIVK